MAVKRFDSSLNSFIDISSSKRFDGTNWVDTNETCRYIYDYMDEVYYWGDCNQPEEDNMTAFEAELWDTGGDKNAILRETTIDDDCRIYRHYSKGGTTRYRWFSLMDVLVFPGQTIILNGNTPIMDDEVGCSCYCAIAPPTGYTQPSFSKANIFRFDKRGSTTITCPNTDYYVNCLYFVFTNDGWVGHDTSIGYLSFESIYVEPTRFIGIPFFI